MARPRLELLARHAAILFVDLVTVEARAMNGTQTFQFVRPAEFLPAETRLEEQREEFAGLTGHVGLCSSSRKLYEKIGILFGQEHCFPRAFIDRVNQKTGGKDIVAEVRQDRQSDSGRAVRLRRGDRSHFAGRPVLSRLAQECSPHRHRRGQQSVLVERRREIFQQRARDKDRRRGSTHRVAAVA